MKKIKEFVDKTMERLNAFINYEGITTRRATLVLSLIILFVFIIRILTIHTPAIDRTTWKEIDYIMISSNYAEHGFHFLYPETSWPAEEPRITAMELPVAPFMASLLYPLFGVNAYTVRFVTLLAFLLLTIFVFKLVRREAGTPLALLSAFFAGILPVLSPFGNSLFSEPLMLFLGVFAIYQYAQWIDFQKRANLIWFIVGFSINLALKPTELYLLLPLLWIHFRKYGFQLSKYFSFVWPVAVAMIIPVLWYVHAFFLAQNYIDVFGVFGGQFGGHDKFQTIAMLSDKGWYILMYWRLKVILLGEAGLFFMLLGILTAFYIRKGGLFLAYLLAVLCFFIIVAEGNLDADYRQLTIIPAASFLIALGSVAFVMAINTLIIDYAGIHKKGMVTCFSAGLVILLLAVFPVRKKHAIQIFQDKAVPAAPDNWALAQEIKKVAADSSKIILAGEYSIHKGGNDVSPVTYYYSGLRGWTIQEGEWSETVINDLKAKGADLFGALDYSREPGLEKFVAELKTRYPILYDNPEEELLLLRLK